MSAFCMASRRGAGRWRISRGKSHCRARRWRSGFPEPSVYRRCNRTQWRLTLAAQALRAGSENIARIAERSGYDSEAAFKRIQARIRRAADRMAQD